MNKETYKQYLRTPHWRGVKKRIHKLRGGKCEKCSSTTRLEVNHLTYARLGNERDSDLELLCHSCHHNYHFPKKTSPGLLRRLKMFKKKPLLQFTQADVEIWATLALTNPKKRAGDKLAIRRLLLFEKAIKNTLDKGYEITIKK